MRDRVEEAKGYIDLMRRLGKTDAEIVDSLREAGWHDQHIRQLAPKLSVPLSFPPADFSAVHLLLNGRVLLSPSGKYGLLLSVDWDRGVYTLVFGKEGNPVWAFTLGRREPCVVAVGDSGHVALGVYAIREELSSDFLILGPGGEVFVRQALAANIASCGFASGDTFAWCVTFSSPNQLDSEKLLVFSLRPIGLILRVERTFGEVADIRAEGGATAVLTTEAVTYRYSLDGRLLNEAEVAQTESAARLRAAFRDGDGYVLLAEAERLLVGSRVGEMAPAERATLGTILRRASQCSVSGNAHAQIQRYLGELALAEGDTQAAVLHFRKALELNPRVGVKKRLQELERSLAGEEGAREGGSSEV